MRLIQVLVFLAALGLLCCGDNEQSYNQPDPAVVQPPPPPPPPPAGPPFDPNDAYLSTGSATRGQLWRLHNGQFTKIDAPCGLSENSVVDKQGRVWISCMRKNYRIEGSVVTEVQVPTDFMRTVTVGQDGSLWSVAEGQIFRFANNQWVPEPSPPELAGVKRPALVVDTKGRPYISSNKGVWMREGGVWKALELPNQRRPRSFSTQSYPYHLLATESGSVFVKGYSYWNEFIDGQMTKQKQRSYYQLSPRPGGGLYVRHDHKIMVISPEGKTINRFNLRGKVTGAKRRTGMAKNVADGQDRLWIPNDYGLIIVDSQGNIQQWEPGQLPGFTTARVRHVIVAGKGPTLPQLGPKVRGVIKGRFTQDMTVEICDGGVGFSQGLGLQFYGSTPCQSHVIRFRPKVGEDGSFRIENVPPYWYTLVFKRSRKSWGIRELKCCGRIQPGEERDIGTFP